MGRCRKCGREVTYGGNLCDNCKGDEDTDNRMLITVVDVAMGSDDPSPSSWGDGDSDGGGSSSDCGSSDSGGGDCGGGGD